MKDATNEIGSTANSPWPMLDAVKCVYKHSRNYFMVVVPGYILDSVRSAFAKSDFNKIQRVRRRAVC